MAPASSRTRAVARWIARILAALFVLLWGGFFLHHLDEWYLRQDRFPPAHVTGLMLLHFGFLAGLVAGFRWEKAGGLLTVACGAAFFGLIGAWKIWHLWMPTLIPGLIWLWLGLQKNSHATGASGPN